MMTVGNPHFSPEHVHKAFLSSGDAAAALGSRTVEVDGFVAQAYRNWLAGAFPRGMALVAVGGYGRRELFPQSDIDLLLLVDKEPQSDDERHALSAFLRALWDAGLRLSQSVRTAAECGRLDQANIELTISLLDRRFLIGDSSLYDSLNDRMRKLVRSQREALLRALCGMTRARHGKFHDTIHHLEPNIKESPGGFRDLQVVRWLQALREAPAEPDAALGAGFAFLADVRWYLHKKTGRDNNLLSFDVQEDLAEDPATWMREYFRHAREVHRAVLRELEQAEHLTEGGLIRSFRDWRTRLSNSEFSVIRDRVFLKTPQQLTSDPSMLLRVFEFVARHGIRLSLETERRIHEHVPYFEEYFATAKPVWSQLKSVLSQRHTAVAVRAMHDTGVLHAVLPAWENIECLVVRDFYHRYTVDEHTLVTLEYVEELQATQDPSRRRFAELLSETPNVAPLYLALLFHDTGKSAGLEGHAQASSRLASLVLERIGVPEDERELAQFLIEHHLDLSAVMNSRDLSDPATAIDLAARVQTLEKLKYLTLLTYADISAVNPEAMTPWRLEQLWRTYVVAHRELTKELETLRIHSDAPGETSSWLEGFPTRYLRTHTAAEIDRHKELADKAKYARVATEVVRHNGTWILTVVTEDRPGLFAKLAGSLAAFGMNIVKAEAFANASGFVLDTFAFEDRMRTLELNPAEIDRLQATITKIVLDKEDVGRLLRGRPRPKAPSRRAGVRPTVSFDNDASESATLVEIVAQDRPGLLYELATTLSAAGCSIDVVLIGTEVHKAIDVFYVTSGGQKIDSSAQDLIKEKLLDVCRD